ncbi:MAG: hypothetical protein CK429_10610 [Mycobacterium sp.]|nr:MAG: hypothetical protein CK429_10610 [Mycobacterium sp.]
MLGHGLVKVLLFGATGAVGRSCLDVLTQAGEASVVLAGRDEARLREVATATRGDISIARLDLTDLSVVPGCDVVINCAGPSHRLSASVAGTAIAAGLPYIDPGGDQALLDRLTAAKPAVPVVLQAGVQPGLSGLLLCELAADLAGDCDDVTAWCGGLQRLTPASVLEYLASLQDGCSHPGAELRGGRIHRVDRTDRKIPPAGYFSDSVTLHPHLDAETVSVAAHLGIGNVLWMNVFDGMHTTRAMQGLALDGGQIRDADLINVSAAAKLDMFGRRPYFAIVGVAGARTVAFTCPDSYRVTGATAAYAARLVAGMPAGVLPFWRVDEPRRVLDFVTEMVPEAAVAYADHPASPMIEEGAL